MQFSAIDFTGNVSSGNLLTAKDKTRRAISQETVKADFHRPSMHSGSASTYRTASFSSGGSGSSGNTSGGVVVGNEEFHRLLNDRDSQLKREMDRRARDHQEEIRLLKEEISLLRNQAPAPITVPADIGITRGNTKHNSHHHAHNSNNGHHANADNNNQSRRSFDSSGSDGMMSSGPLNDVIPNKPGLYRGISGVTEASNVGASYHPQGRKIQFADHLHPVIYEQNNNSHNNSDMEKGSLTMRSNDNGAADDDDDEEEGVDLNLLPEDTFSYLAFSKWRSTSMFTALAVVAIQVTTLSVLALDFASIKYPGNRLGVPVSVNSRTATIQVIALFIIVISQGDLQDSLNLLFMGYDKEELEKNLNAKVTYRRWLISLCTRLLVTILGLCITFVMIVRESDVTQLLLDFTSIEFVTNIDNIFFWLTAWGYLGLSAQRDATAVIQAKAPVLVQEEVEDGKKPSAEAPVRDSVELKRVTRNRQRKRIKQLHVKKKSKKMINPHAALEGGLDLETDRDFDIHSIHSFATFASMREELKFGEEHRCMCYSRFPRFAFLAAIYVTMLSGWAINYYWQRTGTFVCDTVFVQFNDIYHPGLATFSGLFEKKCGENGYCKRAAYVEVGHGNYSSTASFIFCDALSTWVFAFDEGGRFNCQNWLIQSPNQNILSEASYNILESVKGNEPWTIKLGDRRELPMPEFTLTCYDCMYDDSFCGRGTCVNNRCICDEGWYGYRCDYFMPCGALEVNPLHNLGGSRTWAGQYKLLMAPVEGNETDAPPKLLTKYNRPTYIGGGIKNGVAVPVEIIFYNGRRWVNVVRDALVTEEQVQHFLVDSHGYWSDYRVSFITGAIDINTPEDSTDPSRIDWLEANPPETDRGRVQGPNLQNNQIDLRLLCSSCNNETNPCFYGGTCMAGGNCVCEQGEKDKAGTLCQIPPSGNGFCDVTFNTPQFNFDGGDCCEGTCASTVENECGVVERSTSLGNTLAYIGFPNCTDPDAVKQISGSQTLFNIMERGQVICGTYKSDFMSDFFAAQCQAVAAAVLGDKDAYSIDLWGSAVGINRFLAINDGKYDIIFGSDFLANRDVYEKKSKSPFSYAAMPYYFAGLTFAGIPRFVECADSYDFISPACQGVKICVSQLTSWYDVVANIFPPENIVGTEGIASSVPALGNGLCNVFGATRFEVLEENVVRLGYDLSVGFAVGERMHSKSFETWMTRSADRQWTKMTSWIFEALVQAEESGITQASASIMESTIVFNDPKYSFDDMFRNAVAANGNFGELWDKSMPFSRPAMNTVCDGTSGLIVAMDFGAFGDLGDRPSQGGQIERIIQRGALVCSVSPATGFAEFNEQTNSWTGLEVDICRAIAAAIFNGQPKVDFVTGTTSEVFTAVKGGNIDLAAGKTRTLEREIKHSSSGGFAFDFSPPYFYDGMIFAGYEPFGRCAANLIFDGTCEDTLICVSEITTWYDALVALGVPDKNILMTESNAEGLQKHLASECNALVYESNKLNRTLMEMDEYFVGTKRYTKEPLSMMHRSDDQQFSDLIRWIIYGLFNAEERGITSETSIRMPTTNLFGSELTGMWQNSVRESGSYGDIFSRNLDGLVAREGLNLLNRLDGPQLCASPGTAPFL
ncbi:unnamed protein product [Cylindrotheca closterium]|uniref:Solute-binding protein family 3/N-terminal domain-containing protein n=1 Tax=Cylindrotheca closterium TaxID=2856 RepID=A0AAD2FNP6_9STRA|nr:unnamed protein product [Cylindrotheca closterium]